MIVEAPRTCRYPNVVMRIDKRAADLSKHPFIWKWLWPEGIGLEPWHASLGGLPEPVLAFMALLWLNQARQLIVRPVRAS